MKFENIATKPLVRGFLNRHEEFFGKVVLKRLGKVYMTWTSEYLGDEDDLTLADDWSDRLLTVMAAELRRQYAQERYAEKAAGAERRLGGYDDFAHVLDYAGEVEAYAKAKGIPTAPLLTFEIKDGASAWETELARRMGEVLALRAQWSVRAELACWPAWRRDAIQEGVDGMVQSLGQPMEAAVMLVELDGLGESGPHDLFRVLVRHYAGLPDPDGTGPEGVVKCAEVRRVLAGLGLIRQPEEDARTALALALPQTRDTLEWVGGSLQAWLAEDPSRAKAPSGFPLHVPMRPAVAADMVDMGFVTKVHGGLRLTPLGMEACRLVVSKEAAKPEE